jgi:acetoin utilization deacetylase AcuC-like enzyme
VKIVYHPDFAQEYAHDPAASPGRLDGVLVELRGSYQFVQPDPASEEQLARAHSARHIESVRSDRLLFHVACLAAGGAIAAARLAFDGEPGFGLVRPPGHHASRDHAWGFCFFNNIAVALMELEARGDIRRAFILDFDLHFGDGSASLFAGSRTRYYQPRAGEAGAFLKETEERLESEKDYDILAVSAGFDRHREDWGGALSTEDYRTIGEMVKRASTAVCNGRRFAVLEGGYNHGVLGKNVAAFLEGLE